MGAGVCVRACPCVDSVRMGQEAEGPTDLVAMPITPPSSAYRTSLAEKPANTSTSSSSACSASHFASCDRLMM